MCIVFKDLDQLDAFTEINCTFYMELFPLLTILEDLV